MSRGSFEYHVIKYDETTNDNIFHISDGRQKVYSKMLSVVRVFFLFGSVRDYNPQTLSCCQVATHLTDAIYDTYQNTASFTVDGSGAGVETTVQ